MLCFRCRKLLIPYSEGELESGAREKVERHLSRCERCRSDLEAIRCVANTLLASDVPAAEPSPDLWAGVRSRIAGEKPERAPRVWIRAPQAVSAAAMLALVAAVGLTLMRSDILTQRHDYAPSKQQNATAQSPEETDQVALGGGEPAKSAPVANDAASEQPTTTGAAKRTFKRPDAPREASPVAAKPHKLSKDLKTHVRVAEARPAPHAPAPSVEAPSAALDYYASAGTARGDEAAGSDDALARERVSEYLFDTDGDTVALAAGGAAVGVSSSDASTAEVACGFAPTSGEARGSAPAGESVLDELTETEGIRMAALFTYP